MRIFLLALLSATSGCLYNNTLGTNTEATRNVYKIKDLQIGMHEEEVFRIMSYPNSEEQIVVGDGCYDVWFYVTRGTVLDQGRLQPRNLTPLIFKDGIFLGVGYDYYNWLVERSAEEKPSTPAAPAKPDEEDRKTEQLLKPTSSSIMFSAKDSPADSQSKNLKNSNTNAKQKSKDESAKQKKQTKDAPDSSKDEKLGDKDRRMLEDAQDENFNDW